MQTFGDILNELKTKSKAELSAIVQKYADKAAHALGKYLDEDTLFASYAVFGAIIGTVISDGYFSKEEYEVALPILKIMMGDACTYEQVVASINQSKVDSRAYNRAIDNIAAEADDETKYALFVLCAALCVADKNLNMSELSWLNRIIG